MPGKDSRRGDRAASDHAARLELRRRFGRLLESLDRTLAALERAATPAAVHGARVLARRLRMLLRVFLRASAPTAVDREIEALRQIGHYLDAVREADVARQEIAQLAAKCGSTATQEIAALIAGKGRERKRAERILKAYLHRT